MVILIDVFITLSPYFALSITYNVTECGMVLPNDNATEGEPWPQTKK
jgi:hypothetical protein